MVGNARASTLQYSQGRTIFRNDLRHFDGVLQRYRHDNNLNMFSADMAPRGADITDLFCKLSPPGLKMVSAGLAARRAADLSIEIYMLQVVLILYDNTLWDLPLNLCNLRLNYHHHGRREMLLSNDKALWKPKTTYEPSGFGSQRASPEVGDAHMRSPCLGELAVTRGPGEDHIDLTRMQRLSSFLARRLLDTGNAVKAVETSGSRNVGMEGADFDSPSPTGV
ncbi:hypothetical protein NQZ68_036998 [Dissostichus eleginoides]|nr:hypothetical protein NQZ68_036998 [Dissostichus eleginoides]